MIKASDISHTVAFSIFLAPILTVAEYAPLLAHEPIVEVDDKSAPKKELLLDRLMAALPLEAEQTAILNEANANRGSLLKRYLERGSSIAVAFAELENCLRNGTDIDVRSAIRDGSSVLQISELEALVTLYESDDFKILSKESDPQNMTPEFQQRITEIISRPEVKKFSRLIVSSGFALGLSGKQATPDRDCKTEHQEDLARMID